MAAAARLRLLEIFMLVLAISADESSSHPPTLLFFTGIPGSGKTTIVKKFIDEQQQQLRAQSSSGGCAWLESEDASLLILGKWGGYHDDDNGDGDGKSALHYRPNGDGTDRLGGPMPSPSLLRSCTDSIAALRMQGKARLVIADGLLFLLDASFVDALQEAPHGFRVLIRELDVDEETAEERRSRRDGEHVAWECDEACEDFFAALRARPQWEAVSEERALPLMRTLAAEQQQQQSAGDGGCTADA